MFYTFQAILVFREVFEKMLSGFSVKIINHGEFERVYIIEDSLVLLSTIEEDPFPVFLNFSTWGTRELRDEIVNNAYYGLPTDSSKYYQMKIEELTPNQIDFHINQDDFKRELSNSLSISIVSSASYQKFQGFQPRYWMTETTVSRIDRELPQLQLRERYDAWPGILYNYIIYEVNDVNGNTFFAASYTKGSVVSYVNKMGTGYIETGTFSNDNTRRNYCWDFDDALRSWKGVPRQKQLEEHLEYFVIKEWQKEFDDIWKYADQLLAQAYNGAFSDFERFSYIRPTNKWITEELVYKLVKKLYRQYKVIYQHRPFFLKSSIGGQMSYDIFIPGLNVAIEYQGKQHFEPVDFFGGEAGFVRTKERDTEKLKLSKKHGVHLVYINYWEDVNDMLIRTRIEEAIKHNAEHAN